MAGTRLTGWRKVLLLGVVGCLGLGAVLVVAGGGTLWWAASTAAELGDPMPAPTAMTVALEPVTLSPGAADAGRESRLVIDLSDGEFDVIAGEPGSDVRIDGVMATNYYELVEERDGVGRDGPVTAIRLRPTAGGGFRMPEGCDQLRDVAPAVDPPERLLRFDDGRAHPADDHQAVPPSLHVARV